MPAWAPPTGGSGGAQQADIDSLRSLLFSKAPLASPLFSGVPRVPTATFGDDNTEIANTAFVQAAIRNAVAGLRGILAGLMAVVASKAPLLSPTFIGAPRVPTVAGTSDSSTKAASTGFVQAVVAALGASGSVANADVNSLRSLLFTKAPVFSPRFVGVPRVPTAAAGTSTEQAASTAFTQAALAADANSAQNILASQIFGG
jgi:hypothetical protein